MRPAVALVLIFVASCSSAGGTALSLTPFEPPKMTARDVGFELPMGGVEPEAANMLGFALHLYGGGEYYRAITELHRFLYRYPGHALAPQAVFLIAESYFRGGQSVEGMGFLLKEQERFAGHLLQSAVAYKLAFESLFHGDHLQARIYAGRLHAQPSPWNSLGLYVSYLSYVLEGYWAKAGETFQDLSKSCAASALFKDRKMDPEMLQVGEEMPYRSPLLAAALSTVLPGSGQLYAGKPMDALAAAVTTGSMAYLTYRNLKQDDDTEAATFGSIGVIFDLGNIYNAWRSAEAVNGRSREAFRRLLVAASPLPEAYWHIGSTEKVDGGYNILLTFIPRTFTENRHD